MPSMSQSVIAPALRQAADHKIGENERFQSDFASFLEDTHSSTDKEDRDSILKRLTSLVDGVKRWQPYGVVSDKLTMWTRRIEHAKNDQTITTGKLLSMENDLKRKLEQFGNRLELCSIHNGFLKEALQALEECAEIDTALNKVTLDDGFELVEDDLESVHAAFEQTAFSEKHVDTEAITKYISGLFEDATQKSRLISFQREMTSYGNALLQLRDDLGEELVQFCIEDLLTNELLGVERKIALQHYLHNETALRELTSMLNSKSIHHWNWRDEGNGLPVTARKNVEGKYCITVVEDIMEMIFLHSLAIRWSMQLKDGLAKLNWTPTGSKNLTLDELEKREYYLYGPRPQINSCATCHPVMGPIPPSPPLPVGHSGRRSRPSRHAYGPPPPPPAPPGRRNKRVNRYIPLPPPPPLPCGPAACLEELRSRSYIQKFFMSRLPKREGCSAELVAEEDTQAELLKVLALEIRTRETLDGVVHGFSADFCSFASSMPHQTILTVLEFMGVPKPWIEIFRRFLRAPLNMGPVVRGTADQIRTRTAGVPLAHGFEVFFGEALLSCLDMAVRHKASSEKATPNLYRLRDTCQLVGSSQQCTEVMDQVKSFAKVMGLEVSIKDLFAGAGETIGFVNFKRGQSPHQGNPGAIVTEINIAKVTTAAHRLKKKLANCTSVYELVATWNNTFGTYAPDLFGPLANIFGKAHLDSVTKAYNLAYEIVLDGKTLTDYFAARFPPSFKPEPSFSFEAFIHLPTAYGGLGVKNPFTAINLAQRIIPDPQLPLKDYLDAEVELYKHLREAFYKLTTKQREQKLRSIFNDDEERMVAVFGADYRSAVETFPSLEVLTADRELEPSMFGFPISPNPFAPSAYSPWSYTTPAHPDFPSHSDLVGKYMVLSDEPPKPLISASEKVLDEVYRLSGEVGMKPWDKLSVDEKWALGLYGDECFKMFGGLEMWWANGVPRELMKVVRGLEDEDEDDASTVWSYMSDA